MRWFVLFTSWVLIPVSILAQKEHQQDDTVLEKVVVLSRHGVRAPLQTVQKLAEYSHSTWPQWDVPPGLLTSHGRALMTSLGSFYALYYDPQGLFPGKECERSRDTYVWSDTDERDVATASGFLGGLFPGCDVPIHHLEGAHAIDPVIHPLKARVGAPDKVRAAAEVLGRVGGDAENVKTAYMPAFLTLDRVLGGCGEPVCKGETPGREVLFNLKATIEPAEDADHLIQESKGPLGVGSTLSEILLLEYADGKPMNEVGFGRLSRADLTQVLGIHSIYFELSQETDYPARVQASNLMQHILSTLRPTGDKKSTTSPAFHTARPKIPAFGPQTSRFVFLATHDTNIANASGFLRAHWMMPGDQADPTPPGGGLVFELRRDRHTGKRWVRLYFISETLDQMHDSATLTLDNPPVVAPVFIPGCSVAAHHDDCLWDQFAHLVDERTLWDFTTH